MYLKALEIQGFKSFADKTVLTFDEDITAIVGPNGSGKSNISDAIRWVMGEQSSKTLRGAKMEDVIFGGTASRPQLGFAEVSLILDNTDHAFPLDSAEVMVTRRYYRSGESEYYINRQSARLRDINELFMDTGLGREGYSNIGQGRIDEILSVKSTDRREIFEEAAGISKYRHRKEETERRLLSTEDNLLRIGDKISELELQLEPLRQQSRKAEQYLSYREQLRGLEVTVWLDQYERLNETAAQSGADLQASAAQLEQAHETLQALYESAENFSQKLHEHDLSLESLRAEISEAEAAEQRCLGEMSILQNNLENSRANLARVKEEIDEQDSRTGNLSEQIAQRQARIQEILQSIGALEERLRQATENSRALSDSAENVSSQLLALRTEQAEQLRVGAEDSARRASVQQLVQELQTQLARLQEEQSQLRQREGTLRQQADENSARLQQAGEQASSARNRVEGFRLRLQTRTEKRDTLKKQQDALAIELDTMRSRIRMYQEMERDYDGYSRAVKALMQEAARGGLKNIHGPVSRLIQVGADYTTAIETALGAGMQHIVVSAEEDGRNAIGYLKRRDLGRATFLPLTAIRGRRLQESGLEQCEGFLGLASDLVQCEERYRAVVADLLGRTAVTRTLDQAIAMSRKYAGRFRIVTLDGQVMNAGGSMTGGSAAKNSGILARDNARKELQAQEKVRAQELEALGARVQEAVRQAAEAEFEATTAADELRQAQDNVLRLEGEAKQYTALLQALQQTLTQNEQEQAATKQRLDLTTQEAVKLEQKQVRQQAEAENLEHQLDALMRSQTELSDQNEQLEQSVTQLRLETAALEAERSACNESVAQLRQLEQSMQGDRVQRLALITQYEQEISSLEQQLQDNADRQQSAREKTAVLRDGLRKALEERQLVERSKTTADKQAQEQNKQILLLERETARLEQKKATSELEVSQIIDRLWDSYELTYSAAQPLRVEVESMAAAGRQIASLKQKISALGTPNLGAIEEFQRVSERYGYLTGQRDDVLQSRKELQQIISGITQEMTQIFTREFQRINEYFGRTFTEMFGGGKASLQLEDAADPLGCGIEIRVQPPGKQLKTITLLSGGEKAFVAIALYFAILRVRPTSFCMLDEIDAALDERNVARFAGYLRNLSQNTQFIVITHRRGTMEACDVLYGVTMQEQGVSRVLGIDLNEIQAELGIE